MDGNTSEPFLTLLSYEECLMESTNPMDSLGLLFYCEWKDQNENYLKQMYNSVIQILDFKLEVIYPIDYITKACEGHTLGYIVVSLSKQILNGANWFYFVENALFFHPRNIASSIFDEVILRRDIIHNLQTLEFQKSSIEAALQGPTQDTNPDLLTQEYQRVCQELEEQR